MTTVTFRGREFSSPGPGAWELDAVHMPRPLTAFGQGLVLEPFVSGFRDGMALYGLMLDTFQPVIVHGFWYYKPLGFGAPKNAAGPPPKLVYQLLTRLHPKFRARLATSRRAIATKAWRDDLRHWEETAKPEATRKHLALQSVDLDAASDAGLAAHLTAAREQMRAMWYQHMRFTSTAGLPVGDFLAHAMEWTGLPAGPLLQLLRGSSKVSLGVAAPELEILAEAIRKDPASRKLLEAEGATATATIDSLLAAPGETGRAMRAFLDVVANRSTGYDVGDLRVIEMPEMLVGSIQATVARTAAQDAAIADQLAQRTADVRQRVPEAHRALFDELLTEARATNRLRDERGLYSDGWATGLGRRALLGVGKRLAARGRLSDPTLAVDARHEELLALLSGSSLVSESELKERRDWRTSVSAVDVPPWLGSPPSPPPPTEWLPAHSRRAARAIDTFIGVLFGDHASTDHAAPKQGPVELKGLPVGAGTYEGTARIVRGPEDFAHVRKGDVLVARATSAYFSIVLPLIGAVVTDRGGQLCHAAIVAREAGIPGVVGTGDATTRIPEGARVRVDGANGTVTVIDGAAAGALRAQAS